MKAKFACSVLAVNQGQGMSRHTVFMAEAANSFEAEGFALALCRKFYPIAQGWSQHHVVVCPDTNVASLETSRIVGDC